MEAEEAEEVWAEGWSLDCRDLQCSRVTEARLMAARLRRADLTKVGLMMTT